MTNFNKIEPLSDNFYNQTRKLLLNFIEEKGLEGYLVTNPANIFYFTGFFYVTNERPSGFYISKDSKSKLFIPLLEIYLFIEIGGQIGAFNTILIILSTAIAGIYFVRLQGLSTLKSGVTQIYQNQIPIYEMMSGAALAVAAVLLIIPGFATDIVGFLLIIPLTRNLIFKFLGKKYTKRKIKDDLIEGEYEDKDK